MESILAKALGQDVTQMAATEKRLLLSRLLARLAHEIRNPLSSLDVHVQLLEEDLANAAPQSGQNFSERLEIIRGELRRLEIIVKQFLRLAGPSALELEEVNLAQVIHHVCELLRPEAQEREIQLTAQAADDLPPLRADSVQLTQALLNILINALQAVDRRGRVEIRVEHLPDKLITVEVSDSGPGIPADKRLTIFEPYYTTKSDGSGLGLWIAQQIVTAHGGDIQVSSQSEGGAVFAVRLPLRQNEVAHG